MHYTPKNKSLPPLDDLPSATVTALAELSRNIRAVGGELYSHPELIDIDPILTARARGLVDVFVSGGCATILLRRAGR